MEPAFPILFAAVVGFTHAFEADHLVAVGNIVTRRKKLWLAAKDGIFWGLGHSSTVFLIGLVMLVGKATFLNGYFGYFEAGVGLMLMVLGGFRIYQHFSGDQASPEFVDKRGNHHLAYGVGLVHGLAGSGAMILLVMTKIEGTLSGLAFLAIFGLGSVLGMLTAAGVLGLPFSQKILNRPHLRNLLSILSSLLCLGYGLYVVFENL